MSFQELKLRGACVAPVSNSLFTRVITDRRKLNKMALEQERTSIHTQHGHINGLLPKTNNDN
jgi:hypothetical protein